jgi:hypothetical protein
MNEVRGLDPQLKAALRTGAIEAVHTIVYPA